MKVQSFLALKFLSGSRRSLLASSLTWIAILGVLVSVTALIVVEAVMSGFSKDLRSKVLGFSSHITLKIDSNSLLKKGIFEEIYRRGGFTAMTHFIDGEAILRHDEEAEGLKIRGIDPKQAQFPDNFKTSFEEGESWQSLEAKEGKLPGILLGNELANNLGVVRYFPGELELIYPLGEVGPTGELEPQIRRFRVIGTFKSGYYDYDQKFAVIAMDEAKNLLGEQVDEQIGLFIKDPFAAQVLQKNFENIPGVLKVSSWAEQHSRLFSALKLERIGMRSVLGMMILLSSFNVLSMLMMMVFERRQEIAVLRALGLSQKGIASIFYRAGWIIACLGGVGGLVLAYLLCKILAAAQISLPAPYYIESLPVELNATVMLLTFGLLLVLSMLTTILPALQGKKLEIVEALSRE